MKILVVYKTSKLDVLLRQDAEAVELLAQKDPGAHRDLVAGSESQTRSFTTVREALSAAGIEAIWTSRDHFTEVPEGTDVVMAVGGDGTVLEVSHLVVGLPVVALNSDPVRSTGYYCAANAADTAALLVKLVAGELQPSSLARLQLTVDGERYPYPCLNDLLVANENPCMMSRYVIDAGKRIEKQSSSGIWISTAAGSTAGIRSAGGTVMPLDGALIQYLVREPYTPRGVRYELLRGVRHLREGLKVQSLMHGGRIYVDGPWLTIPFGLGARLELSEGPPLVVLGMDPAVRER
jgi:NAD kinase